MTDNHTLAEQAAAANVQERRDTSPTITASLLRTIEGLRQHLQDMTKED